MLRRIIWAVQLMQNTMGIRNVKLIEFFNKTFSISIWPQIAEHGYQEDEIFQIAFMDYKEEGRFWHDYKKWQTFL